MAAKISPEKQELATAIYEQLRLDFPDVSTPLHHSSAHELLFAVMLSAQCTDKRVNIVTPQLFQKYPTVDDYAEADLEEVKELVRTTGFYNNKAKNIVASAQMIRDKFGGQVPDNMAQLIKLPGIARKSANVVLSQWFGKHEGIAVDTHVIRLTNWWGLVDTRDPVKIEQVLMQLYPAKEWGNVSLRIIFHGRHSCPARKGGCFDCSIASVLRGPSSVF